MSTASKDRPAHFGGARCVVVKIGSSVLREGPDFDRVTFVSLVRGIAALRSEGLEVVVVCSGAVALGMARLGLEARPTSLAQLQATAAVGQGRLMRLWSNELEAYGLTAGQLLLTHDDMRDRRRFLAARHTLRALLEAGAVPVVNENDTVAIEEIKMGDNDLLSAQVVSLIGARMLILLSDVEGLYDRDPSAAGAAVLPVVQRVDEQVAALAGGSASGLGSGGMRTKVEAVRRVNELGVPAIIAFGKRPRVLRDLYAGTPTGTWFLPEATQRKKRKHWIAYAAKPAGRLMLDAGAVRAVREGGRSLLPIGITGVEGAFGVGDLVSLVSPTGEEFARGLVSHDAPAILAALGQRSGDNDLGTAHAVVHRDDLALLG